MKNKKHIRFNDYILQQFFRFVKTPGNHIRTPEGGLRLKPGIDYQWTQTSNPNQKQVEDKVWHELIIQNFKRYNHN